MMFSPLGMSPGSRRSIVSSRQEFLLSTGWRTTVETNIFVSLPIRKRSVTRIGVRREVSVAGGEADRAVAVADEHDRAGSSGGDDGVERRP